MCQLPYRTSWCDRTRSEVIVVVVFVVIRLDDSQLRAEPLELADHFLLDQVEGHRQQRHAEQHVDGSNQHLQLPDGRVVVVLARNNVTETDRRDGDKAAVRRCWPAQTSGLQGGLRRPADDMGDLGTFECLLMTGGPSKSC